MGIGKLSSAALVPKAQGTHDLMVGNALYPAPSPTVAVMQSDIDALAAANAEVANNGGKAAHQAKRIADKKVRANLKSWLAYVQMASGGDADKILKVFELVQPGAPVGELAPPKNVNVRLTNHSGRVSLNWTREDGADMHHIFISTKNEPFEWVLLGATTKSRFNADNLKPGTFYWFAVTALGAAGESSKSEPALAMAAA